MIISDLDIKKAIREKRLVIEPFYEGALQPVSVDLTLGDKLRVFERTAYPTIDVKQPLDELTREVQMDPVAAFYLQPSDFVLGVTRERIELPADLMGRLDGKSSLGRLGLLVHSTAGFIDPGFKGKIVLEFSNVSPLPLTLYAGMPIAQISFYQLSRPAGRPYGHPTRRSKYQDQDGPTPSQYYRNFDGRRVSTTPRRAKKVHVSSLPTLRQWLERSPYKKSVTRFAEAVGVKPKTVEDWVYGRNKPSAKHMGKLFELTGLAQYSSMQAELPTSKD